VSEHPPASWPGRLLIVGSGLMGTSLGLAIRRAGGSVHLHDRDPERLALAASLGAGEPCAEAEAGPGCGAFDVAVVAVPPRQTATVCVDLIRSGVAAVVMLARFNSANAAYGESYLLVTILAAVLGGVDPFGGFGKVGGLLLALIILQVISSAFNLLNLSQFLTLAIWGGILIAVAAVPHLGGKAPR